jgi:hypothetical protein
MTWKEFEDAHFTPEEQREDYERALRTIRKIEHRQKRVDFLKKIFFIRSSKENAVNHTPKTT